LGDDVGELLFGGRERASARAFSVENSQMVASDAAMRSLFVSVMKSRADGGFFSVTSFHASESEMVRTGAGLAFPAGASS
jgi:hypothetical protein